MTYDELITHNARVERHNRDLLKKKSKPASIKEIKEAYKGSKTSLPRKPRVYEKYTHLLGYIEYKGKAALLTPIQKRFVEYNERVLTKNRTFTLTIDQFEDLLSKPCHYCGTNEDTHTIDRYDNNIGYEIENCVPCCLQCNLFKRSMSPDQFYNRIRSIYNHLQLGG